VTIGAQRLDDRRAIVDAAYACLAEPHADPVPVSAILRRAGVSSRAFYRHFTSKDDLLLALLRQECESLAERLDRIARDPGLEPREALRRWIDEVFENVRRLHRRLVLQAIESDDVRSAQGYAAARERLLIERERSLTAILRRGRHDGSFAHADPDGDAVAISAVVSRIAVWLTDGGERAHQQSQAWTLDFALRAVGGEPLR
jgi:AcrR family transcriptional regulator